MKVSHLSFFSLLRHAHRSHLWTHPTRNTSLYVVLGVRKMKFEIVKLRDSVSDTLHSLSVSVPSDLSFPSHCCSLLETLSPVTFDEVGRILSRSPAKSSSMDIIPTSLVLRCKPVFCEIIAYLANLSFSEGRFPALFKQATVTPLIKGHSLDKSVPNYRPISNLNFISKVLERLFLCRFQSHSHIS